jgi:hypothetical protein
MRQDYARLIINCTRTGGDREIFKDCRRNRLPDEDLPTHEPMKMWTTKGFSDRLRPLYGMLRKNCGRYWDDVWSEICAQADIRNVAGWHLRSHITWMVSTTIAYDENGKVVGGRRYGYLKEFHVDKDGILCETNRDPAPRYRRDPRLDYKGAGKVNGCWFKGEWRKKLFSLTSQPEYVFVAEKQLNRKELKRLGLKNDNQL